MFSIICILYYHRTSSKISKRMLPCCAKLIQLCPTLCNPLDCSPLGSSVHGILRQEYWSELPCPPPGDLPNLGTEPTSFMSSVLAGRFFTTSTTWEIPRSYTWKIQASGFHSWLAYLRCDFWTSHT